jgi:SAM-dependent methyltransferase
MEGVVLDVAKLSSERRAILELRLQARRERGPQTQTPAPVLNPAPGENTGDDQNLVLTESAASVDGLLANFYERFPWPWQPAKFDYLKDQDFAADMLNQDIGDWTHTRIGREPDIWVAGCGTNQALHTALKFPKATVLGSDLSTKSLDLCANNARELGVENLRVREESLNGVPYDEAFDYIISTGVIHHNADPGETLAKLARALKPGGVLELMVYNRYHRITTSTFQKAVRIFGESRGAIDFDADFVIAKKIAASLPKESLLDRAFVHTQYMEWSESDFADLFIHPVEHSYTVESLEALADSCGLEFLQPCISLYAKSVTTALSWNMQFNDPELQEAYDSLPDSRRWQVSNLLMFDKSPMLWFYLQRKDSDRPRQAERDICDEFLSTRFARSRTMQWSFVRGSDDRYRLSSNRIPYPQVPPAVSFRDIVELADGKRPMREIFRRLGMPTTFQAVNQARIELTTSAFPHLRAIDARTL